MRKPTPIGECRASNAYTLARDINWRVFEFDDGHLASASSPSLIRALANVRTIPRMRKKSQRGGNSVAHRRYTKPGMQFG
jgi:hypothetical protein